jgi:hypothetical protein
VNNLAEDTGSLYRHIMGMEQIMARLLAEMKAEIKTERK